MNFKNLNRVFGFLALIISLVVYMKTAQETVPFWDCGEFSAATVWQQVPHPPGAPLFLMIAKLFHMFIPFGDPGWKINLVSAFASAFTVFFLYHITVLVIRNFTGQETDVNKAVSIYGGSFVGAMAFTFSDTFWFNAVESEVYAMATLFVAIVVWLMMKWNEEADNKGHERYLLLIAYILGLSTGVHLLSILAIFSIVFLVYLRKYKFSVVSFVITGVIAFVIFVAIYPGVVMWLPAFLAGHTAGRNKAYEYAIENNMGLQILAIGGILAAIYGMFYGYTKKNNLVSLVCTSFVLVILGYTTYTHILIRSNSNTPMNENQPTDFTKLASYLGREQYGNDDKWPRRVKTEQHFVNNYESKDEKGEYVYGEWYPPGRKEFTKKDGTVITVPHFEEINFGGEIAYLWKYQMNQMYFRYFYWNFVGRSSDEQDAPATWFGKDPKVHKTYNFMSGYESLFPIRFFAFPLFIGLVGLFIHFKRDPKVASVMFLMFLMMGVFAAIAQQQQDPQPRERDYFYTGSFLLWGMWIGLGVFAIAEYIAEKYKQVAITALASIIALAMPLNMAVAGWKLHDRSGNMIPFDYSYNILQSTEQDAIMFTNGDNDTFPLWYLQDVMGVRRDVRIVNLSLGNTLWYIDQLKNQKPWGAKKVPLTFSDDSLRVDDETDPRALSYDFGEALNLSIPVKKSILAHYTNDTNVINSGMFRSRFIGQSYGQQEGKEFYLFRVQDKVILNILREVKFERPIYFANTVSNDVFCGLEPFFRYEGMVIRVCPTLQNGGAESEKVDLAIMEKCLMNIDNTDNFSTTPKYGFKLRNLNNPNVYYDPVARRLMMSYRQLYTMYANAHYARYKNEKKAAAILDKLNEMVSPKQFPMSFDQLYRMATQYKDYGNLPKSNEFADMCVAACNELIENSYIRPDITQYEIMGRGLGPHRTAAKMFEMKKDYISAKDVLNKLKQKTEDFRSGAEGQDLQRLEVSLADIAAQFDTYDVLALQDKGDLNGALKLAESKRNAYNQAPSALNAYLSSSLDEKIRELNRKLGKTEAKPDTTMSMAN